MLSVTHFFRGIRTLEEAKQRYLYWAKRLHPDSGTPDANADRFKILAQEYNDVPVLLRYLLQMPPIVYVPVAQPLPPKSTTQKIMDTVIDVATNVAVNIPPEQYVNAVKWVASQFTSDDEIPTEQKKEE